MNAKFIGILLRAMAWLILVLVGPFYLIQYAAVVFADFGVQLPSVTAFVIRAYEMHSQFRFITIPLLIGGYVGLELLVARLPEKDAHTLRRSYWIGLILLASAVALSLGIPMLELSVKLRS